MSADLFVMAYGEVWVHWERLLHDDDDCDVEMIDSASDDSDFMVHRLSACCL